jgi:predicted nucleic acid-binding Zn ribbon protein
MKDDPIATCPECEGSVKRLLYPVGVVFKGSGWYINDSRKPEKNGDDAPKPEAAKPADKPAAATAEPAAPAAKSAG